ncbi:MAG: hypothetical protein LBR26_13300 [Prevotella sp.]|jgi:hypothetical protein|nr:hypothetical protein [Prevotella sp.]
MDIRLEDGGVLDMKPDAKLNITMNNPMLANYGTMSLPVTLPDTANNTRHLGAVSLQAQYKYRRNHDVIVEAGVYRKQGLLRIASGSKDREAAIYMEESPMYARMKEVDMPQAFNITRPASDFHVDGTFDDDLDMMIKYMELVMVDNIRDDFYLFPVATDYYNESVDVEGMGNTGFTFYWILNEQMSSGVDAPDIIDTDLYGQPYLKLAGRIARQYREENNWVDVPKGYGITPFLKQGYVLRRIFEYFGYELRESIFDTDPQMQKIVVLNNTADTVVNARIKYSQLVPSVKISDYLESIRTDYGCEFFLSADHKYVEVKFWNDLIDNKDYKVLDSCLSGDPVINLTDPKLIKLANKRSIEFSNTNFDTLNKFQDEYYVLYHVASFSQASRDGYYFIQSYGQIWERLTTTLQGGVTSVSWKYHSQYLFDFYLEKESSVDDDYESKESNREHTANLPVFVRYTAAFASTGYPGYNLRMLFIGKRRHLNTTLKPYNKNEDGTGENLEDSDGSTECPVMAAFYRGRNYNTASELNPLSVYGNIYGYDSEGLPCPGGFDLIFGGLNGLYQKFWAKYAAVILDSFYEVNLPLRLDLADIMNFRFDNIYMVENQPLLPQKLSFSIDLDNNVEVGEALFRTIKLYK